MNIERKQVSHYDPQYLFTKMGLPIQHDNMIFNIQGTTKYIRNVQEVGNNIMTYQINDLSQTKREELKIVKNRCKYLDKINSKPRRA